MLTLKRRRQIRKLLLTELGRVLLSKGIDPATDRYSREDMVEAISRTDILQIGRDELIADMDRLSGRCN